jgi:gliding motility-associated-like protein
LTGLAEGTYNITITDTETNCSATDNVTVNAPPSSLLISSLDVTEISCSSTGAVTISASGGWGAYEYELMYPSGSSTGPQRNNTFSGLNDTSGNYTVTVRDAGGCEVAQTFAFTPSPPPVLELIANTLCYDSTTGLSLTANVVSGGTAPFQYRLNGGAYQSGNNFTGLGPGSYTIEVIDSKSCTDVASLEIFPTLTATSNLVKGLDCSVSPEAEIEISIADGSPNYTYEVFLEGNLEQTSTSVTSIPFTYVVPTAGTYTFNITDASGCTVITTSIVDPIAIPGISLVQTTEILCNGDNGGTIQVNIDGTTVIPPYTISVVNVTTATSYGAQTSGLPAGTYEVTVTDSNSCSNTESIIIDEPDPIVYDVLVTPITCDLSNGTDPGSISVTNISGGTKEYTYYLTGNNGHSDSYTTTAGGEDHTFAILEFGIYQLDVVDANGCSVRTTNIIASPPDDLDINVGTTTVDCNLGGTAIITVNSILGSGNYEFAVLETFIAPYVDDPLNDYQSADSPGGNTATFTGLIPGITYSFVVHDLTRDCYYFGTAETPIDSPSNLTASLDAINNITCTGNADGNVSFTIDDYAPDATNVNYEIFNFQSNTTTGIKGSINVNPPSVGGGVTVADVGPLAPGVYYILFDEVGGTYDGCSVGSEIFTISESTNPLEVTASLINNDNCNSNAGQVSAIGQFGTAPYEYQIALSTDTPPTMATWTGNATNVFNLEGGNYIVYIKDANNCIQLYNVIVPTDPSPAISLSVNNQCAGSEGNYAMDITLTAAGIAPYGVRVDGGAPRVITGLNTVGNMITIPGLNSGSHTFEIMDSNGCGEIRSIMIAPELQASTLVMVQPSCIMNDGVIAFTITGGSGSYTAELLKSDLSPSGIGPSGNEFIGVPFGDYVLRVTDNTLGTPNCYVEIPISLEEPTPITLLTADWTDVGCFGGSDGSIAVNLESSSVGVNDNPPYFYEITNGASSFSQSTGLFTGLTAGVWDISVTSNRNCIAVDQVTIGEPTPLTAAITNVTAFACDVNNAQQMAVIEVSITSGTGTPNYFYSVNGGNFLPTSGTIFTYEVLNAGNYDIVIRDANGCLFALPTQTIIPINTFTAAISQISAISCAGPEEILITVTDDGNPANSYSFELLPLGNPNGILTGSPTSTSSSYSLNAVGNYTFRITDNITGCYIDIPYDIAPYDLMEVSATTNSPVTCFGYGNGALDIQIAGYSGAYTYEVFTQAGIGSQTVLGNTATNLLTIDGLSGGNYFVRVTQTEFPFCLGDSNVITIGTPIMPLTAIVDPVSEAKCINNQGEILVDPSGGYAPYDIVLTNTTTGQVYNISNVGAILFTGLSAGIFNVQVTDNFGCVFIDAEVLSPAIPIVANAIPLTTMLSCYNDNNATVTAIVTSGGSGNYEYRLNYYDDAGSMIVFTSGEQTSDTFMGLGAGIYSITVTDGWNCDVETNQVTITQPPIVFASLVRTDPLTCTTGVEFELTATGGSGTYEYSSDNMTFLPMTSNPMGILDFGVLGAGTFQYYVRDAINGCEAIVSNAITENPIQPLILTVDKTAAYINCTGENTAVIRAVASGGLGNYQYELYLNSIAPANRLTGPQSIGEFKDLVAGTYWVNVISEDCTTTPEQVIIEEPIPLTYTDQVVDVSCFGEENGTIMVNLAGGAGGYIYSISPNLDKFDSINIFTDLAPGDYAVIAQDQNGCFEYLEYTISEPAIIEVSATTAPEICVGSADGSISLSISGGTAPYSTAINSNADTDYILGRTDFSDLSAGDYLIFIKDAKDCETYIVATIDPGVNIRATVEPVYECIGNTPNNYVNIILEDQSVLAEVMYGLDTTDPEDMQLDPNFRNIAHGDHYVTIAHANGCIETVGFFMENYDPLTLTLEQRNVNEITAVAHGGRLEYTFYLDGIDMGGDNTFRIRRTGTYEVRVMDENGCEAIANIFMEFIDIEMPNFYTPNGDGKNDFWKLGNTEYFPNLTVKIYDRYGRVVARLSNIEGWDGTYEGKELPTGDYWYVVQFNEEDYQRDFFGHFTLYR